MSAALRAGLSALLLLASASAPAAGGAAPAAVAPPDVEGVHRRPATAADGVRIATFLYVPERPEAGRPTVVLLPDLGTTHAAFELAGGGFALGLMKRGHRVASLDWRGTGLSETPATPYALEELARFDVPAAIGAVAPEGPVVLVGWGYGGTIAAAVAAGPLAGRIAGVVLLDGPVALDVPNDSVRRLLEPEGPLDLVRALARPAAGRSDTLFDLLFAHGGHLPPALTREFAARALAPLSAGQVAALRSWMATGATQFEGQPYPQLLTGVKAPVLALTGLRDNWTHPEFAAAIRDVLPRDRVRLEPVNRFEGWGDDAGHLALVLGPLAEREIVPRLDAWLRALVRPEGGAP